MQIGKKYTMYVSIHHENKARHNTHTHTLTGGLTRARSLNIRALFHANVLGASVSVASGRNLWAARWLTHLHYKSQLHSIICLPGRSDGNLIRCPAEERHKFLINCSADLCTALT